MLSPMDGCEHPLLYLSGTGRASQKRAISDSCQQALFGIYNSVWVWWLYMGWIPRWVSLLMVISSVSAPHFASLTPSMGILFCFLRSIKYPHFGLLLEFHVLCKLYLGYSEFLGYYPLISERILSVFFCDWTIWLPVLGWYPPDPPICLRIS